MLNRRIFLLGLGAAALMPESALAAKKKSKKFVLDPKFEPQTVSFSEGYAPGTLVVDTPNRFLYLVETEDTATRFGIGVGQGGARLKGTALIGRKAKWPHWRPTDAMIKRAPHKYARYAGGMAGGPRNPLGARALYLYRNHRDTMYRIHGTTEPWSIGQAVSNGCVRMINAHVEQLYERVNVGTFVVIL